MTIEIEIELPLEVQYKIAELANKDKITFEEECIKLVQFALDNGQIDF